jgi:hypothetical protein
MSQEPDSPIPSSRLNGDALPPSERMKLLERRAKFTRSRLLRAVDALDARRRQVVQIGEDAKALAKPAALSLAGVAALVGAGALAIGLVLRSRRRRSFGYRLGETLREAGIIEQPSFARRLVEKVSITVVGLAATEVVKRMTINALDGRAPDGRKIMEKALEVRRAELGMAGRGGSTGGGTP